MSHSLLKPNRRSDREGSVTPSDLPIVQKTYDLIKWYIPILNRLPRNHKFHLGDRTIEGLYDLLENLIYARYATEKINLLETLNARLDVLRYQTRLLYEFDAIDCRRYEFACGQINEVGKQLGGWLSHQKRIEH